MNFIIDIGNTVVKAAVFHDNSLKHRRVFSQESFSENFREITALYPNLSHAILSSVAKDSSRELKILQKHLKVEVLNEDLRLPFVNKYASPKTLGKDRIALIAAAALQFPEKNVLLIDAGTCITYDFKNAANEYLGGAISLGVAMQFKALHEFTANLPLLKAKEQQELIGDTTESSIQSGVLNGTVAEIDGIIDQYKAKYEDLTVIFTGGDTQILSMRLKNSIFALPNILLEGLNYILEFNKTQ